MTQRENFREELRSLREIRKTCDEDQEDVLCFYTDCLIKMHKAYYKPESVKPTDFYIQPVVRLVKN